MPSVRVLLLLLLSSLLFSVPALAQSNTNGALSGRVSDPSDAAVAGATVVASNVNTGVSYRAASSSDGFYTIRFLPPGRYTVSVEQPGFRKSIVPDVVVETASNPTVNLQLTVGQVSESVTVRESAGMVEAQTADRGTVIDSVRMESTPSQARNVMGLVYAASGVTPTNNMKSFTPYDNSGSSAIKINGSQSGPNMTGATNEMLVDGVPNRNSYNGAPYGLIPTQESVSEMKVVTNAYSAEYGRTTGGVIAVMTKSGTNGFHGELFEYNRSTGLAANTFERNLAGQSKLGVHYNTPGGSIGGPILRNKLFFFSEFQRLHSTTPKSYIGSVPTPAEREGDFSNTFYNSGGKPMLQTVYDPWTTVYNAATGTYSRTPFAGNIIPKARQSAVAQRLWQYIPLPNAPGDSITHANNYVPTSSAALGDLSEYTERGDYNINDRNRLMVRYMRNNYTSDDVAFYDTPADPNSANSPFVRANHNAVVDYTRVLSPTSVLSIRTGMQRYLTSSQNIKRSAVTPADLGFSSTFVSQAAAGFPAFGFGGSVQGGAQFSGAGAGSGNINPDQINSLDGSYLKTLGRHTLKLGAFGRLERYYAIARGFDAGNFTFNSRETGSNPQTSNSTSGSPLASFLLGVPASAVLDLNSSPARQNLAAGVYVQDDFNVSSKLKVNLGLRWDWDSPVTDRYNAMTGAFDPLATSPLASQVGGSPATVNCPACSSLKGGLTFPGVNGTSRSPYTTPSGNLAPRIGVAYSLNDRTVFRAGWGFFYGPIAYDPGSAGFSQTTNAVTLDSNYVPQALLDNPFPTGLVQPVGSKNGLATNIGTSLAFVSRDAKQPRSNQFSFDVQRELPWNVLLSAGYSYNGISRIPVNRNLNALTTDQMQLGASVLNRQVANPFAGLVPGFSLNQATVSAATLLTPYPQFSSVTENSIPVGNSAYHGFMIQLSKRYSSGLSMSVAYTRSRHMGRYQYQNASDSYLEKTLDLYDIPNIVTINAAWELPFGHGRAFGSGLPRWADAVVGGWKLGSMTRIQSGAPFQIAADTIPLPGVEQKASNQNLDQWVNPDAFALTSTAPAYLVRRWSLISGAVRLPGIYNFDLNASKSFRITERFKFELMNNWVNAFNTPQWWSFPTSCQSKSNSCFGRIANYQTQTNYPRQIQIAGRLTF